VAAAGSALTLLKAQEQLPKAQEHLPKAQEQKEATFSTDVKVVNIFATVRDKKGQIISNLAKDDFTVTEDGRLQTIKYFSRETDLPLTLGLLVDTSLSQRRVLGQEKTASFRFLDRVLRADKDKTFVIHFDHESELLQDLTSSRTDLQRALDQLELPSDGQPQLNRGGNSGGGNSGGGNSGGGYPSGGGIGIGMGGIGIGGMGRGGRRGGGGGRQGGGRRGGGGPGTTMYDAIYLAANEIMKKQRGRKAIILLTDGVDNGSKTFLNDAIEAAQRADTLAYSILFSDEQAYGQQGGALGGVNRRIGGGGAQDHPDGKKILERISKETGGTFFEVSKKLSIDDIFDRLQEELRNQYSIGYTPDQAASSGFRSVKVATKDTKLIVQSREGYYPGTDGPPARE
jgi:VWFA-related protein